jgi:hypothetical protein
MPLPALAAILPSIIQGAQSMMQSGQGADSGAGGAVTGKNENKASTGSLNIGGQKGAGAGLPGMLGDIVKTPTGENQKGLEALAGVFNARAGAMSDEDQKTDVEPSGLDRIRSEIRKMRGY